MPNKTTTDGLYRYAFQGQEKDTETGMEAFELRLWDGRIGRWLTVNPYHEFDSPYLGMGNNPISLTDPDGGSTKGGGDCEGCPAGWMLMPEYVDFVYNNGGGMIRGIQDVPVYTKSKQNQIGNHIAVFLISAGLTKMTNDITFGIKQPPHFLEGTEFELTEKLGRLAGDVASIVQGWSEDAGAGLLEVVTLGGSTPVSGAVAVHGTALAIGSSYATAGEITSIVDYFSKKGHGSGGGFDFKKISDGLLKSLGLDAHEIKKEFLGNSAKIAQYDLYADNLTGEIYIFLKGGKGDGIATGYYIK